MITRIHAEGEASVSAPVITPEGRHFHAEIFCTIIDLKGKPAIQSYFKDISESILAEKGKAVNLGRLECLLRISQFKPKNRQKFPDYALTEAIKLTESKFGYIYYYNEATETFELNSWPKDVMKSCYVTNPQTCY